VDERRRHRRPRKGAFATWRSQNVDTPIPVQIVRSTRIEQAAGGDDEAAAWLAESTAEGFMAVLNKCTHYCCTPKFKSPQGVKFDAEDEAYCPLPPVRLRPVQHREALVHRAPATGVVASVERRRLRLAAATDASACRL